MDLYESFILEQKAAVLDKLMYNFELFEEEETSSYLNKSSILSVQRLLLNNQSIKKTKVEKHTPKKIDKVADILNCLVKTIFNSSRIFSKKKMEIHLHGLQFILV